MVTWRAAAVLEGRWHQVLWLASEWAPRKLLANPFMNYWYKPCPACFRVGTAQTACKPFYELLVQALRDAHQSVDASALQVCYSALGEGTVLGVPLASRKGRLLDGARQHTAAPLDSFFCVDYRVYFP